MLENDQNSSIKTCRHQLNYFTTTNPHGWQAPSEFKPIIIIIIISTIFFIVLLLLLLVVVVVVFLLLLLAVAIFSLNSFNVCGAVIGFLLPSFTHFSVTATNIKNHQTKENQISQHLLLTTAASKVCFSSSFPGLMELEIKQ